MFSCNVVVVSRCAQLVSFLNCLQDVKLSRIAIYRDEFRRMNCSFFISSGELHCESVKIKTMINSSLFFLRQCESLNWSDWSDLVVFRWCAHYDRDALWNQNFQDGGEGREISQVICFTFQ